LRKEYLIPLRKKTKFLKEIIMRRKLSKMFFAVSMIVICSCGGGGGGALAPADGTTPASLTEVETNLLALINQERTGAGLPALVRDTAGLDRIELWFVNDMMTNQSLSHTDSNGRTANQRAQYYSGDTSVNCSEIIQWWGGTPSGQTHYDGYKASEDHHNAYMEAGIFNLGPTSHCGIAALAGNGPLGTAYQTTPGSYSAVMLCNKALTLAIDPFSE
jgi:hypothetical protein